MQQRHQHRGRRAAEAQLAAAATTCGPKLQARHLSVGQDLTGARKQDGAGGGEIYTLAVPLEELDVQVPLRRLNRWAERRLADAQPLGGTAKVQLLGEGDKVPHPAQIQ